MTLEIPRETHQKVIITENRSEKVRFVIGYLLKILVIQFLTSVIHESSHMLSCRVFGASIYDVKFVFLGISATWEHINGIQGSICALSGAFSVGLLSLFVYRPIFKKTQSNFIKQIALIGVVQLSQDMFYWTFGSLLGGIPFPWKQIPSFIDPVYLANSLSLGQYVWIFTFLFLPLWLLCRKLNSNVLNEYCSLNSVQSWKRQIVIYSTKIYILAFQILNIVAFVF